MPYFCIQLYFACWLKQPFVLNKRIKQSCWVPSVSVEINKYMLLWVDALLLLFHQLSGGILKNRSMGQSTRKLQSDSYPKEMKYIRLRCHKWSNFVPVIANVLAYFATLILSPHKDTRTQSGGLESQRLYTCTLQPKDAAKKTIEYLIRKFRPPP